MYITFFFEKMYKNINREKFYLKYKSKKTNQTYLNFITYLICDFKFSVKHINGVLYKICIYHFK